MRVFIEDSFDAAHWLPNVPENHKCRNMHGHTYHVRIEIEGDIDPHTGWVMDYAQIRAAWGTVKAILDHRTLNHFPQLQNSTSEHLAQFIWNRLSDAGLPLALLEVRETAHCGAIKRA